MKIRTAAKWVTHGDGTTPDVDLVEGNAEVLYRVDGLASEGLVDFVEVDVVLRDTGFGENLGDGECRSNAKAFRDMVSKPLHDKIRRMQEGLPHDTRRNTDDGRCDELADNW